MAKKGFILLLTTFMVLCFISLVMANDVKSNIVSKLQGKWHDINGNAILNIQDNTVNGCAIVGIYQPSGGESDFSCIIRIIEADGYRDLSVIGENLQNDSYHAHIILNGNNQTNRESTLLMKTEAAKCYESVGGIYLDMTEKEVLTKYGNPDQIQHLKSWINLDTWKYEKLGLELTMRYQRVWIIKIYKNGNRHFDRTGLNCANEIYEFQFAYRFNRIPRAGQYGAYSVGHGEYLWFDNYPNSITMSMLNH